MKFSISVPVDEIRKILLAEMRQRFPQYEIDEDNLQMDSGGLFKLPANSLKLVGLELKDDKDEELKNALSDIGGVPPRVFVPDPKRDDDTADHAVDAMGMMFDPRPIHRFNGMTGAFVLDDPIMERLKDESTALAQLFKATKHCRCMVEPVTFGSVSKEEIENKIHKTLTDIATMDNKEPPRKIKFDPDEKVYKDGDFKEFVHNRNVAFSGLVRSAIRQNIRANWTTPDAHLDGALLNSYLSGQGRFLRGAPYWLPHLISMVELIVRGLAPEGSQQDNKLTQGYHIDTINKNTYYSVLWTRMCKDDLFFEYIETLKWFYPKLVKSFNIPSAGNFVVSSKKVADVGYLIAVDITFLSNDPAAVDIQK